MTRAGNERDEKEERKVWMYRVNYSANGNSSVSHKHCSVLATDSAFWRAKFLFSCYVQHSRQGLPQGWPYLLTWPSICVLLLAKFSVNSSPGLIWLKSCKTNSVTVMSWSYVVRPRNVTILIFCVSGQSYSKVRFLSVSTHCAPICYSYYLQIFFSLISSCFPWSSSFRQCFHSSILLFVFNPNFVKHFIMSVPCYITCTFLFVIVVYPPSLMADNFFLKCSFRML